MSLSQEMVPPLSRHHDIGDKEMNGTTMPLGDFQSVVPVTPFEHFDGVVSCPVTATMASFQAAVCWDRASP